MFPIKSASYLASGIKKFVIVAPAIARKQKPGQFVIIRLHEGGERIPLTIVESDPQQGTITLIVQGVGKTTHEMNLKAVGDSILDLAGPLGQPSIIEKLGHAVVIGGGVGTAIAYPVAAALKKAGNFTTVIVGARTKDLVILEDEIRSFADQVIVCTDDGSYGFHGFVTDALRGLMSDESKPDSVVAIGPIPMMKAVAECTRPFGIKTVVSLNPIMVDGTGMCGGCRAVVGNRMVFVCVDGPEFDAHEVDFDLLDKRNRAYRHDERVADELHSCKSLADGEQVIA